MLLSNVLSLVFIVKCYSKSLLLRINVNYDLNKILLTKLFYFLLTVLLKNYRKKSKLVDSNTIFQQALSTTIIA